MSDKAIKIICIICIILGPLNIVVQWIGNEDEPLFRAIAVLGGLCLCATGILGLRSLKSKQQK